MNKKQRFFNTLQIMRTKKAIICAHELLLPKELQAMTLEQWRSFIKEAVKPVEPVDQPQTVTYTLEDGTVVVVAGVVPPLTLVEGSVSDGYAVFSDKLGNKRSVVVQKPAITLND